MARGSGDIDGIVWLSTDQMREVDRLAIDEFGVNLVRMMENAGRNLADLVIERFAPATVLVMAGSGGNGGGGLVAARHLANRGVEVLVVLSSPDRMRPVPAEQLAILQRMDAVSVVGEPRDADVLLDALIGYSLRGAPRGQAADLVAWANASASPTVSLDVPSGVDSTTGATPGPCVRAAVTMTLAMPKVGLAHAVGVGELYLADISIPRGVYDRMGFTVGRSVFGSATVVRVDSSPTAPPLRES